MKIEKIKISRLKNNKGQVLGLPQNPRFIKDYKYEKLKKSLIDDPEMLELREIIAYDNNGELVVICGNMRLKAMQELGIKETIVKILPNDTAVEKLQAYTIKDNVGFGEHNWDIIANEWDTGLLADWGLDVPSFEVLEPEPDDLTADEKNKPATMKITFESPEQLQKAEIDIMEILDRKYKGAYYSVSAGEM